MDFVMSHENWSSSRTLDSSTGMLVELCDLDGLDCIPQQFLQESLFSSLSAGDPADLGYGPPLNDLVEQLLWEPEEWHPEEELQVLSNEELQQFWEPVEEVQAPHEEQVQRPHEAEVEVEAPWMMQFNPKCHEVNAPRTTHLNSEMQFNPEFLAVDLSGWIQESGSQDGDDGGDGQAVVEEWNAAWEESNAEEPPQEFVHQVEDAVFPVVLPGKAMGITFHKKNNVWEAHIWIRGVTVSGRPKKGLQIFLGTFVNAKDAAYAHDRVAIKLQVRTSLRGKPYPLNYPEGEQADYLEKHSDWSKRDFIWSIRRNSTKFSKGVSELKGVSVRRRSPRGCMHQVLRYEAKVSRTAIESEDGKRNTYMLGLFKSEEEAGREYDLALLFLHSHLPDVEQLGCITNFRPSSYSAAEIEDMRRKLV